MVPNIALFYLKLFELIIVQLDLLFQVVLKNFLLSLLLLQKWNVRGIFVFIIKGKYVLLHFNVLQSIQVRVNFTLDIFVFYHSTLESSLKTITLIILLVQCELWVIFSFLIVFRVLSEQCFKWCLFVGWAENVGIFGIMIEMCPFRWCCFRVVKTCTALIDPLFEFITESVALEVRHLFLFLRDRVQLRIISNFYILANGNWYNNKLLLNIVYFPKVMIDKVW